MNSLLEIIKIFDFRGPAFSNRVFAPAMASGAYSRTNALYSVADCEYDDDCQGTDCSNDGNGDCPDCDCTSDWQDC